MMLETPVGRQHGDPVVESIGHKDVPLGIHRDSRGTHKLALVFTFRPELENEVSHFVEHRHTAVFLVSHVDSSKVIAPHAGRSFELASPERPNSFAVGVVGGHTSLGAVDDVDDLLEIFAHSAHAAKCAVRVSPFPQVPPVGFALPSANGVCCFVVYLKRIGGQNWKEIGLVFPLHLNTPSPKRACSA